MGWLRRRMIRHRRQQYRAAASHYYRTHDGKAKAARLAKELEGLGLSKDDLIDIDLIALMDVIF